jgi:TPP-dependent pyruvate/acetoin dehydrogenase alpha subunit
MSQNHDLFRAMSLIRRFEERLLAEFSTGRLFGTTHAYIGQEADAVGIFAAADPGDVVFSSHRCHGHFLAYAGQFPEADAPHRLAAELMGKATGLVGGRGGSQHIQWRNFYSNGIQGGVTPLAVGAALAEKAAGSGKVVIVFTGDGTLGEGVYYESMNIAALWSLPVLFVLENNRYAQTTPIELAVAGSIPARFRSFGIDTWERDTTDVLAVQSSAAEALSHARTGGPAALVLHTYRFAAHSKGDDVRDPAEIARYREHDPLLIHGARLTDRDRAQAEASVTVELDEAFSRAYADPFPALAASPNAPSTRESSKERNGITG